MGRCCKKKTTRGTTYNQEDVNLAVNAIKRGTLTIRKASNIYHVPFSTLQSYISGRRKVKSQTGGRPTALRLEDETKLANYLKILEKWGFGLSRAEVLDCVQQFVEGNKIKTPFKRNRPGEDWFLNFKKRHNLSIKKPQAVEYSRKKMTDPFVISKYFDQLHQQLTELDLFDKPNRIWNLDETSVCTDPSKTKIVGQKGKSCSRTTGGSGKENITCLAAASAAGQKAPPLIIFKGLNVWSSWVPDLEKEEESYPDMAYAASTNGWITSDIFYNYLEKTLIPSLGPERPVLLLYDGHSTHVTEKVIQLAQDNNITILKLPPHTSHLLQPLDLSVFKSLKVKWDQKLCIWQRKHSGVRILKKEFSLLFGETWKLLEADIIASGFRKGGIYPFNRSVVPKDKYDPEAWKRWEACQIQNHIPENTGQHQDQENQEYEDYNQEYEDYNQEQENRNQEQENHNQDQENDNVQVNTNTNDGVEFETLLLRTIKTDRTNNYKTTRKRIAPGAEVITASGAKEVQNKQAIPNKKKNKRKVNKEKPDKRRKRSKYDDPDSDSDSTTLTEPKYIDTDDDMDPERFSDLEDSGSLEGSLNLLKGIENNNEYEKVISEETGKNPEQNMEETPNKDTASNNDDTESERQLENHDNLDSNVENLVLTVDQFVCVEFKSNKASKKYVGKILEVLPNETFYCSFLRLVKRRDQEYYVFPNVEDLSMVEKCQITEVLETPTERRGHFFFEH